MSESSVNCQAFDGQYLWAGTSSYLSRVNTSTGTQELFFPGKIILSLAVDKDGSLWVGRTDGLFRYDGQSWTQYNKANSGIPDEVVCKIVIDNNGNKWLRTRNIGLVKFDGKVWNSYGKPKSSMDEDIKSPLAIDGAGNAWMGFYDDYNCAMAKFDGNSWTLYDTSKTHAGNYVLNIAFDPKGIMWAATDKGIVKYDGTNWTLDNFKDFVSNYHYDFSILFDKNGGVWAAYISGLYKSNGSGWTKYVLPNSETKPYLSRSLLLDSQDNLWVGTDKGLWKFKADKWNLQKTCNSAFTSLRVGQGLPDPGGFIWFVDGNGGLIKFDGTNWTHYDTSNGLPAVRVSSIAFDKDGSKWFGSNTGLIKYDDKTWTLYKLPDAAGQFYTIYDIKVDLNGIIWLVTANHQLLRFDRTKWTVYTTTNSQLPGGTMNYSIFIDHSGTKWFPTDYGIVSFDDNDWAVYNPKGPGSYFQVESITTDPQGGIWTFGLSGINKFNGTNWSAFRLDTLGLPRFSVASLAFDYTGNLWLASNEGLIRYDGSSAKLFDKSNSGLLEDEIRTVTIGTDGTKYLTYVNFAAFSVFKEDTVSSVVPAEGNLMPGKYSLMQNYPNPFNPSTAISYSIPKESFVELKVYDMLGCEVSTLVSSQQSRGEYKIQFNASSLPSGVYIYAIHAGEFRSSKKLILIK